MSTMALVMTEESMTSLATLIVVVLNAFLRHRHQYVTVSHIGEVKQAVAKFTNLTAEAHLSSTREASELRDGIERVHVLVNDKSLLALEKYWRLCERISLFTGFPKDIEETKKAKNEYLDQLDRQRQATKMIQREKIEPNENITTDTGSNP